MARRPLTVEQRLVKRGVPEEYVPDVLAACAAMADSSPGDPRTEPEGDHEPGEDGPVLLPADRALVEWMGDDYPRKIEAIAQRLPEDSLRSVNVEQGWWPLLVRLDAALTGVDLDYRLVTIDQVDGRLRLEVDVADEVREEADRLVASTIAEAAHTCEVCGRPDARRVETGPDRWATLCVDDG